jgi:hypothetical protein
MNANCIVIARLLTFLTCSKQTQLNSVTDFSDFRRVFIFLVKENSNKT